MANCKITEKGALKLLEMETLRNCRLQGTLVSKRMTDMVQDHTRMSVGRATYSFDPKPVREKQQPAPWDDEFDEAKPSPSHQTAQ